MFLLVSVGVCVSAGVSEQVSVSVYVRVRVCVSVCRMNKVAFGSCKKSQFHNQYDDFMNIKQ